MCTCPQGFLLPRASLFGLAGATCDAQSGASADGGTDQMEKGALVLPCSYAFLVPHPKFGVIS